MKLIRVAIASAADAGLTVRRAGAICQTRDAIKYRKAAFNVMASHFGRLGPVVKGERPYNAEEVAANVAIVEQWSNFPMSRLSPGSDKGDTRAKPEIWVE